VELQAVEENRSCLDGAATGKCSVKVLPCPVAESNQAFSCSLDALSIG